MNMNKKNIQVGAEVAYVFQQQYKKEEKTATTYNNTHQTGEEKKEVKCNNRL